MNTKSFYNQPWAIELEKLHELDAFFRSHCVQRPNGNRALAFRSEELAAGQAQRTAAEQAAAARAAAGPRSIAVIPVVGPLMHRGDPLMEMFGFTSVEGIQRQLRSALGNPDVSAIVLDFDSPGGEVFGTPELADEIFAARSQKKIVAVANSWAASGAYFLASQASELVVIPSGQVGSIGVYMLHVDWSRAFEAEGITPTYIAFGKFKVEGNPLQPLGEEARAELQSRVDAYGEMFVKAVARGRGVSPKVVRESFGQGRMLLAAPAKAAGMVDRIATLEQVLAKLGAAPASGSLRAEGTSAEAAERTEEGGTVAASSPEGAEAQRLATENSEREAAAARERFAFQCHP